MATNNGNFKGKIFACRMIATVVLFEKIILFAWLERFGVRSIEYCAHSFLIKSNSLIHKYMAKVSIGNARLFRITGWAQNVSKETRETLQKSYKFDFSSFPYVCIENTNTNGNITILLPQNKQSIGLAWFEYTDLGK